MKLGRPAIRIALIGSLLLPMAACATNAATHPTDPTQMLHLDFPVIEGRYGMTKEWSILLPEKFNRRFEDDSLVIWRPGLTMWIIVWGKNEGEGQETRLAKLRAHMSDGAFDVEESRNEGVSFLSYRLSEVSDNNRVAPLYGFAIGESSHVQIALYFDQESDIEKAKAIFKSLRQNAASMP